MPSREIRVLPDHVINQIAAGEVIERPASVVKELVENSIDAGARRVAVEIVDGGKTMVRVVDDGCGMDRGEMKLALTRHATSKLRDASELSSVETMGFRGEALPSIAAVSRMTIISRRRGDTHPAAWSIEIDGGRRVAETEVGAPVGTSIEVRDLLFNLPARQKFMRADATEAGHIADCISKLALAHPDIHLRLRHKKRTTFDAPANANPIERAAAVLGPAIASDLVSATGEGGGVVVRAYLGDPARAARTARGIQLFVGRRPIRDRGLLAAVLAGYGDTLGNGRYPSALVFIDTPPGEVDINVHPQKLEVRFAAPATVYAMVKGVIEQAVAEAWPPPPPPGPAGELPGTTVSHGHEGRHAAERLARYAGAEPRSGSLFRAVPAPPRQPAPASSTRSAPSALRGRFAPLRMLGVFDETQLVCEGEGELVVIHLVAAARRIRVARLHAEHAAGAIASQRLLVPAPVDLPEPGGPALADLGLLLEDAHVTAVPAGVDPSRTAALAEALVAAGSLLEQLVVLERYRTTSSPMEPAELLLALDAATSAVGAAMIRSIDGALGDPPVVLTCRASELARRLERG